MLLLYFTGIGKSTLANEICDKWATSKDHFLSNDYDLVILIRLRTLQERTLQQVMIEAVGSEVAYDELLSKSHGERCLIILEGLDEISADWQKNDKMFNQLVKTTNFLSHANIIVTSRPHACINLGYYTKYHSRTIEIVGFDKSQIKEYAEWFFQSLNTVEKFMEQVNGDPHISSLCYVPLCLNMVLKSFKHNNKTIHTTLTKLYQAFIISQVEEHIRLNKAMPLGTVLKSEQNYITNLTAVLDDVPCVLSEEALETLFLLSKLAYKSYFQWFNNMERSPKIIYSSKDLACCNITDLKNDACGLLKATNTLFYASNTAVYSFNHLSVQEYFCALYISLLPEDEQLQLLKDHITDYPHMWPFYAGITKLRSSKTLHNLSQFLIHDKELFEENILIYCWMVSKDPMKIMEATVALNSLYEAQVSSDDCIDHLVSLYMSGHTLSQYDYTSIFYLVSVAPITCLHLRNCHIGDQQLEVLSATCRPTLKVLDLCWNNITDKGVESLIRITNLTHFSAVHNPIGNAGIQVFSLKYLVQLNISIVGMTAVDTCALSRCFKVSNSLHSLEIGGNGVKDGGITGILNNLPSTLVRLVISGCDLTHNGAENISNILKMNKTLKHLEISSNSIGDDGILAISDSLCVNKTLIQLVACDCQFHSKGAESIAKMLQINETLKYLDISNNQIGDDGTTAVALSVQANATLILLNISNCGFCNQGAEKIAEILRVNKTLKCLEISENYVKDSKMSALASSIQASNTLIKLRLSETRHKTHEFTNETLRLIHESHCSNESGGYLDAVFSSKEMEFEGNQLTTLIYRIFYYCLITEWFIYDSINGMKRLLVIIMCI